MTFQQRYLEESIGDHLKNNWGKYLAGAGTLGAGALAANYMGGDTGGDIDLRGETQTFDEMPAGGPLANPPAEFKMPANATLTPSADEIVAQNAKALGGMPDPSTLEKMQKTVSNLGNRAGDVINGLKAAPVGSVGDAEFYNKDIQAGYDAAPYIQGASLAIKLAGAGHMAKKVYDRHKKK